MTFKIYSDLQAVTFKAGQTEKVDIDHYGQDDLTASITSIARGQAEMIFKSLVTGVQAQSKTSVLSSATLAAKRN